MMPRVAFGPESSERPMVRASVPGAGAPVVMPGVWSAASILRTAMSVPGSVPASVAGTFVPSGRVTVISSSRRMVCSAVTMTPGRQKTPLEENRGRACTATTLRAACATAAAISLESAASWVAIPEVWRAGGRRNISRSASRHPLDGAETGDRRNVFQLSARAAPTGGLPVQPKLHFRRSARISESEETGKRSVCPRFSTFTPAVRSPARACPR